jgi:hypothetical protein
LISSFDIIWGRWVVKLIAVVGIVLVLAGIVSLAYGGFTYTREETVLKVGPLEVEAEQRKRFPISPLAGGAMVVGGLILVALGWNTRTARAA